MDAAKGSYRQYMIDRINEWEGKIAYLNAVLPMLEGFPRRDFEARLRNLHRCNQIVFQRYKDLLMARDDDEWDEASLDLDVAAANMEELLDEFSLMAA